MSTYDPREALLLMADAQERATPDGKARHNGALKLLESLLELNGKNGFIINAENSTAIRMSYPTPQTPQRRADAVLSYMAGAFIVRRDQTNSPVEGLTWDHRSGQWQGPPLGEKDGTPVRCSALAVLVGAALGLPDAALRNALGPSPVSPQDWSNTFGSEVIPSESRWGDDE